MSFEREVDKGRWMADVNSDVLFGDSLRKQMRAQAEYNAERRCTPADTMLAPHGPGSAQRRSPRQLTEVKTGDANKSTIPH
ncbi:hypothetical protein CTA1_11577 [Colletotrichum tanaceti]|uniref:Uncharacterized protein n=1 Tax=Colletotrichum tanaceti TaxID=1306861 RepID=A0A4U6XCB0_9PEZI|nr:hypothetical protein CTA1_11577 [Colletotrichum tanaceti]